MLSWLTHLDRLLRGDTTRPESLRDGTIQVQAGALIALVVILGAMYGLCMGSYSLLKEVPPDLNDPSGPYMQLLASAIKVPALFYLTLLVTFPSLYVFNALVGSRLSMLSVLRLLIASLAVNLAVLASLGPIVLFFSVTTKSYAFAQILNVVVFTLSGVLGLGFLRQTLHRLTPLVNEVPTLPAEAVDEAIAAPDDAADRTDPASALDMPSGESFGQHTRSVFACWMIVFAVVGAQMGWVLRPFIGSPELPFAWFRERQSNFFEAVWNTLGALLTGSG